MRLCALGHRVAAATPGDRDRVVDFLRVASIAVVVLGHWLLAVVTVRDGRVEGGNLLAVVPVTQWLTWGFQVMPVFFFVGGWANAAAWSSARRRGVAYADWVRRRARRLLLPVVPLLAVWVPLAAVLAAVGVGADLLSLGTRVALTPVWFLAAYLAVVALAPATLAAHRRHPVLTLTGLVLAAAVVDGAARAGVPLVGWANFLWVWAAAHQLGYFWFDGRLPRRAAGGVALVVVGLAGMLALVGLLDYPRSMVGAPGAMRSNNSPPTVALLLLGVAQVGVVVALRPALAAWLARPRVWAAVALGGSRSITVFLWHQTAFVLAVGALYPTGLWPARQRVDGVWWATRPVWFAAVAAVLGLFVVVFGRFERAGPPRPAARGLAGAAATGVGTALASGGLAALVLGGLYDPSAPLSVAVPPLALLAAGVLALGVVAPSRKPRRRPGQGDVGPGVPTPPEAALSRRPSA